MTKEYTCLSGHEFTTWVAENVRRGLRIVPFVGSGMSAASGILTSQLFVELLTWTVFRSVKAPTDGSGKRIDVREGWPSPPQGAEIAKARDWVIETFKKACGACGFEVAMQEDAVQFIHPISDQQRSMTELALRRPLVPSILWRPLVTKVEDSAIRDMLHLLKREDHVTDFPARADVSPTSQEYIEECAVRSLHDWRSALRFLARLRHCQPDDRLELGEIEAPVIDSFNNYVISGRRHNFAHTMLGHLAQRARIRLLLTTNFDTLIEDAFEELHEPLRAITVHLRDPLPHPDAVHARSCVVKLHGESVETRADFSLDFAPTPEDKRRFFHYVQGYWPGERREKGSFLPGILLVCGYSGSDLRCIQMVKYLLDTEKAAKVLWICHSQRDLENLYVLFDQQGYQIAKNRQSLEPTANSEGARIVATVTDRSDLLLYELYQRLTLCLPPGGASFQFIHNVPPGTSFTQTPRTEEVPEEYALSLVEAIMEENQNSLGKVIVADGATGLSGPLRQTFNVMTREKRKHGIWLELEDYADVLALAHEIFTVVSVRRGEFQRDYAHFLPPLSKLEINTEDQTKQKASMEKVVGEWKKHINILLRKWRIDPADWFIALYGRNGPGGCAAWGACNWKPDDYIDLDCLLRALREVRRPSALGGLKNDGQTPTTGGGFSILYAPFSSLRQERDKEKTDFLKKTFPPEPDLERDPKKQSPDYREFRAFLQAQQDQTEKEKHCVHEIKDSLFFEDLYRRKTLAHEPARTFEDNMKYVMFDWIEPIRSRGAQESHEPELLDRLGRRLQFLYSSVLFRQSRHFSALLSQGVYPCPHRYNLTGVDNDWYRYNDVFGWLDELNKLGHIFFRKPGGFAWMYRDTRLAIQQLIETRFGLSPKMGASFFAGQIRARNHYWIADWHLRAFRATGHAIPLLEACYHFVCCIRWVRFASTPRMLSDPRDEELLRCYRQRFIRLSLFEMTKCLRMGRDRIRYWLQNVGGEAWFGIRPSEAEAKRFGIQSSASRCSRGSHCGGSILIDDLRKLVAEFTPAPKPGESRREAFDAPKWLEWLEEEFRNLPQNNRSFSLEATGARSSNGESQTLAFTFELGEAGVYAKEDEQWRKDLEDSVIGRFPTLSNGLLTKSVWDELFAALHSPRGGMSPEDFEKEVKRRLDKGLKDWRDKFLEKAAGNGPAIHLVIQGLFELTYLQVRRAKALEHAVEGSRKFAENEEHSLIGMSEIPGIRMQIRVLWVQICSLCWLGLDFCAELPPPLWETDFHERSRFSTLYGLALGRLFRFFEAHRRLNEAAALRAHPEELRSRQSLGIVALRRAEVYLIEANRLCELFLFAECVRKHRIPVATIQDWLYLERRLSDSVRKASEEHKPSDPAQLAMDLIKNKEACTSARMAEQYEDMYFGSTKDALFPIKPEAIAAPDNKLTEDNQKQIIAWDKVLRRLYRLHYARLDDAWTTLDLAAEHLKETHVAIWTSRLNALRLLVFALHYPRPIDRWRKGSLPCPKTLAFRRQEDHIATIDSIFRAGIAESDHRRHADIRLIDYASRAAQNLMEIDKARYETRGKLFMEDIKARLSHLEKPIQTPPGAPEVSTSPLFILQTYYDRVQKRIEPPDLVPGTLYSPGK